MNLIDRYIYAVTERLPENTREDISRELRANIEDMLSENPTEAQVREVLEKLGSPSKLASEYSQTKRYLIGPELYDSYISVLKLVLVIVTSVLAIISLLKGILGPSFDGSFGNMTNGTFISSFAKVFADIFTSVLEGLLQAALWVTLVFALLERAGINEGKVPFVKKKWTVDALSEIHLSGKRRISRVGTIISMFLTLLFTSIFYFAPHYIGWYTTGDNGLILVEPLFNDERLGYYIPIILLYTVVLLCISIWKFISMEWNLPLAFVNTAYNLSLCVFVAIMINDSTLFSQDFLTSLANAMSIPLINFNIAFQKALLAFLGLFVIANIFDSVEGFVKCKK